MKLLLVEDDLEMADALRAALSRHGIVVDAVTSLAAAREAVALTDYEVVLIDRQLPDGDGSTLLMEMRNSGKSARSIIISALGSTRDKISGLNEGADDYLPKPFEIEELIARMGAVLRRAPVVGSPMLVAGNLTYDRATLDIHIEGNRLVLTRRELLILDTLLRNRGRTVLRSSLEENVYSFNEEIQSNTLEANMSRLRRKLAEAGANIVIKNIRGIGYFLHEPQ